MHGAERGIMCSTTGQWVREYMCKASNLAENYFGEFCTGPHNESAAVKWENRNELCSPGTVNLLVTLSQLNSILSFNNYCMKTNYDYISGCMNVS